MTEEERLIRKADHVRIWVGFLDGSVQITKVEALRILSDERFQSRVRVELRHGIAYLEEA